MEISKVGAVAALAGRLCVCREGLTTCLSWGKRSRATMPSNVL